MEALKDSREKRAVEMREGYFNESCDRTGNRIKTWIPDSRKTFISSVEALKTLLSPEIKSDEKFGKSDEKFKAKIKEAFDKYAYTEKQFTEKKTIEETKNKFIPQISDSVILINPKTKRYTFIRGGWDSKTNAYFDSLIEIYDFLFEELNNLLDRTGYFEPKKLR